MTASYDSVDRNTAYFNEAYRRKRKNMLEKWRFSESLVGLVPQATGQLNDMVCAEAIRASCRNRSLA
jgi:hypothetical protein